MKHTPLKLTLLRGLHLVGYLLKESLLTFGRNPVGGLLLGNVFFRFNETFTGIERNPFVFEVMQWAIDSLCLCLDVLILCRQCRQLLIDGLLLNVEQFALLHDFHLAVDERAVQFTLLLIDVRHDSVELHLVLQLARLVFGLDFFYCHSSLFIGFNSDAEGMADNYCNRHAHHTHNMGCTCRKADTIADRPPSDTSCMLFAAQP